METEALTVVDEKRPSTYSLSATVAALNKALVRLQLVPISIPGSQKSVSPAVWFKENSPKNLRTRDFLAPSGILQNLFSNGQVPEDIKEEVKTLKSQGVLPFQKCVQTEAGLQVQVERPRVFSDVLSNVHLYTKATDTMLRSDYKVILNCVPLHGCRNLEDLSLSHLRAILVTSHIYEVFQKQGLNVLLTPAVISEEVKNILQQLRVNWPSRLCVSSSCDHVSFKQVLEEYISSEATSLDDIVQDNSSLPENVLHKVHLKSFIEKKKLEGYDPNLNIFLVQEENLKHLTELHQTVYECCSENPRKCTVIHIVCCEEEFKQQKMDILWRILDPLAQTVTQKHLVCGSVKATGSDPHIGGVQFIQVRKAQMKKASVMKYGHIVQGDSWDNIISTMTLATIKFEMLSTAHRSLLTLDLTEDASVSTKGTKSGAFVMYNCARLATLFESYNKSVEQGLYPKFPVTEALNYSSLREEGEWLLLFNYIIPFPDVLGQLERSLRDASGIRLTANIEVVCKHLISLSMDFSSYYNRIHILGEPLPHLFSQMFARLQLMKAVRNVFHTALETLQIPPLNQI
ncbi:DALR anticodon-binding domain-containing protein 3 [Protopterus annectens]|uniref:DALR anticodon-binding domain-containing protein 3 n=1 Tax=Protopterus annectens TaxID=7888 RepID=UPI001CFA8E55|nr:DALR anticodon-binding domain-containing protein 3 [Protopterus annectens]